MIASQGADGILEVGAIANKDGDLQTQLGDFGAMDFTQLVLLGPPLTS